MKTTCKLSALTALFLGSGTFGLMAADPVESFYDSTFSKLEETVPGKFNINNRLRYEIFELDNGSPYRDGVSNRLRYGYTTPNFGGFTAMAEGETVSALSDQSEMHPADAAGDGTDLNQLWVQYADVDYGKVKVGRQVYTLDDHRFIGHVGWRQNIQSFDALTAVFNAVEDFTVNGFFLDGQNAVNGTHNELDAFGMNASLKFSNALAVTAFVYNIDGDDVGNAGISSDTIGIRATGSYAFEKVTFKYALSLAQQESNSSTPGPDYEADYFAGDISAILSDIKLTFGAGFEILEPQFSTPLATLHKFNGFADVFLPASGTGIANGLEDYYVYAGYTIPVGNGINAKVVYHWFEPETGTGEYGDEIDVVTTYKINKYLSLIGKYGDYESDGGSGGVGGADKKMFTFELNFIY